MTGKKKNTLTRLILWRTRHIPPRQFIIFLSLIIGMLSGLAAVILKNIIHLTEHWLTQGLHVEQSNYIYFLYPALGILLTWLFVRFVVRDNISHGVARVLYAISKRGSILKPHNTYSSMVASALTIGFGGSVGSEAPIVLTGASLGSSIGRWLHLNYKHRTLLLGCGAAGAIAGIFKAPIAGVVFTLEILMLDLTLSSIVPLLISSVTAAVVAYFLMGQGVLFNFHITDPFLLKDIPYYILLGVFTGLVSFYFTKISMKVESTMSSIGNVWLRLLAGGLVLGLFVFAFPPLFGEGYTTIRSLLTGNVYTLVANSPFYFLKDYTGWFLLYVALIFMLKVVAMAVTNGAGGVGGVFAPSLFTGGVSGFFLSRLLNLVPGIEVSDVNFSLVGMAGLMAGVMHAPLTGIFLIAEITGGYALLIPLILTATVSYLTIVYFEPYSIYTKRLAKRGELITHDKDHAVLTLMDWRREIEKDLLTVRPDDTLGALVKTISRSRRNLFPVLGKDGSLLGVVMLDNVREIMFNRELYDKVKVRDLMVSPPRYIYITDTMETVLRKFNESGAWNLPVLDRDKYIGVLSKSRIFAAYRRVLVQVSEE
ncbi:MAG: chloride channel protein [Bacteroidales bacterium]|nr:chloride channel protein [Bacteroidales bacterium]